jgi:hypothetical protein
LVGLRRGEGERFGRGDGLTFSRRSHLFGRLLLGLAVGWGRRSGLGGRTDGAFGPCLDCLVGVAFRRNQPDCRALLAAGAGAGLTAAFNAPVAGAVFVPEELVRRFETRTAVAALGRRRPPSPPPTSSSATCRTSR